MSALIEIRNLLIKRRGQVALEIDSLQVDKGEVLAVVGPNGAGKSTLLLALARLIRLERGQILFDGNQAQVESDAVYRRRLALVLQDPLLFDMSVFDNVASGLRFRGVAKDDIHDRVHLYLERLGVSHLAGRRAMQLSGGEAQRVSLARALVLKPQLFLLDEPFSALDPPTRARLLDDLRVLLPETGATTIFVTHNLSEADRLASKMAIILNSKIQQIGSPADIRSSPFNSEVANFFAQIDASK